MLVRILHLSRKPSFLYNPADIPPLASTKYHTSLPNPFLACHFQLPLENPHCIFPSPNNSLVQTQACLRTTSNRSSDQIGQHREKGFALAHLSTEDPSKNLELRLDQLSDERAVYVLLGTLLKHYAKTKALYSGRRVHACINNYGYDRNTFLANCLVDLYGTCGSMGDARAVFDTITTPNPYSWNILIKAYGQNGNTLYASKAFHRMPLRDVVSWNAMISAFAQNQHSQEALQIFHQMLLEGSNPDKITFVCALDACASLADLQEGRKFHVLVLHNGHEADVEVGAALINLYGKCRSLPEARLVFGSMPHRDIITWNAMITAFTQNCHGKEALDLFRKMQCDRIKPSKVTFVCALYACASLAALKEGLEIHAAITDIGYDQDIIIGTALITMHGKCGSLSAAKSAFMTIKDPNIVSWNALIAAFSQNGDGKEALALFRDMQLKDVKANNVTFVCVSNACVSMASLGEGNRIHAVAIDTGSEGDFMVKNALINMYAKCGSLDDARSIFDRTSRWNIVSWNTMISALGQNQSLNSASSIFVKMPCRDVTSWNTMIAACSQNEQSRKALDLFHKMHVYSIKPNKITYLGALDACAYLAALEEGQEIHASIIVDSGYEEDDSMANTLISMYGKCGSFTNAWSVFDRMSNQSIISWNALIAAIAQNGYTKQAVDAFYQMQTEGIKPDAITFINVLTACSFTGCVEDGKHYFVALNRDYGLLHTVDHCLCMIDLLGRAGHLNEAECLIKKMPSKEISLAWFCLLGACRIHGDVERALRAANYCFQLDPENITPYVMLSNIYATSGRCGESDNMWW